MPQRASYTLLHSLKEGSSILVYSRTRIVNLNGEMSIHKCNAVRLQIPKNMAIILHETRNIPQFQPDKDFHSYVWPKENNNARNRSSGLNDGIAREVGNRVYRNDIHQHTYKHLYDKYKTNCENENMLR